MTMSLNLISTVLLCLFTSESLSLVAGANLVYGSSDSFINCNDYMDSGRLYHNGKDTGVTGDRYFFSNVTFADGGQYECKVDNQLLEVINQTVNVFADLKPLFQTCDLRDGSQCERTVTQGQTVQVCVDYSTIPATLGSHEPIPLGYRYWTININGNEKLYDCNSSVCWTSQMRMLFRDANSTCFVIGNIQEDAIFSFDASTPMSFGTNHNVATAMLRLKVQVVPTSSDIVSSSDAIQTPTHSPGADSRVLDSSPSSAVVSTSSDIVSSSIAIPPPTQDSPGADSSVSDPSPSTIVPTSSDIVPSSVAIQTSTQHSPGADPSVSDPSPSSTVVSTSSDMVSSSVAIQTPTQHSPDVYIVYGTSNSIDCSSNGNGRWYHNGVDTGQTGRMYNFPNVTFADEGQYECRVGNRVEANPTVIVFADVKISFRTCDVRHGDECVRTVTQGQTVQVCVDSFTVPAVLEPSHRRLPRKYNDWIFTQGAPIKFVRYTCNSSVCWLYDTAVTTEDANSTCCLIRNLQKDTNCIFVTQSSHKFGKKHKQSITLHLKVQGADSSILDPITIVSTSSYNASSSVAIQSPQPTDSTMIEKVASDGIMDQVLAPIFLFIVMVVISVILGVGLCVSGKRRRRGNPDPSTQCSADGESPIAADRIQLRELQSPLNFSSPVSSVSFAESKKNCNDLYISLGSQSISGTEVDKIEETADSYFGGEP